LAEMKIISHRGNLHGPDPLEENRPETIDAAIDHLFDVEIDIRLIDGQFFLGHDDPQYYVNLVWLKERKDYLWLHCKNRDALYVLKEGFNAFWHQEDDYALTSWGYIWTYPDVQPGPGCILVDLLYPTRDSMEHWKKTKVSGVCTDYASITASVITSIMV